jgi:hypothetical protein
MAYSLSFNRFFTSTTLPNPPSPIIFRSSKCSGPTVTSTSSADAADAVLPARLRPPPGEGEPRDRDGESPGGGGGAPWLCVWLCV